jgi:hypothetical protein
MTMIFDGSNGLTMQTWTTTSRPASPVIGQTGFNTTYNGQEVYNGSAWTLINGGPAFSAYAGSTLSTASAAVVNVPCDTKVFDTNTCYNNTGSTVTLNGISVLAYAFAPNVPGYYQISAGVSYQTSGNASSIYGMIYKNGSVSVRGNTVPVSSSSTFPWATVNDLVYCNGTSDYIQFYATQQLGSSVSINNGASSTYFKASFVRGV